MIIQNLESLIDKKASQNLPYMHQLYLSNKGNIKYL